MKTKICRVCGQEKNTEFFDKAANAKDGLDGRCKECKRQIYLNNRENELIKRRQNYHNNKERYSRYFEQYRQENRTIIRERERKFYQENQSRIRAERAQFAKEHPDIVKEWRRREHQKHHEYYRQKAKRWNIANKSWHNAYQRAHPETGRLKMHRRRIRVMQAGRGATPKQWRALLHWFGSVCQCCGSPSDITIDHVVPISKGGTNHINNLQPLCKSCNDRKGVQVIDYRHPMALASFLSIIAT